MSIKKKKSPVEGIDKLPGEASWRDILPEGVVSSAASEPRLAYASPKTLLRSLMKGMVKN